MRFTSHSLLLTVACLFVFMKGGFGGVAQASVITDNPAAWRLTFSDEFSGSSLDATKWAHRLPGVRNSAINTSNAVIGRWRAAHDYDLHRRRHKLHRHDRYPGNIRADVRLF